MALPYRHLTLDERRDLFGDVKGCRGHYPMTVDNSVKRRWQPRRKLIRDACLRQHVIEMSTLW